MVSPDTLVLVAQISERHSRSLRRPRHEPREAIAYLKL